MRAPLVIGIILACSIASAYDRSDWKHWSDLDGDGRDSREELIADSVVLSLGEGETWICPYTGIVVNSMCRRRSDEGRCTANTMDADHIIPLGYAAQYCETPAWTAEKREAFANDPENLVLVYYASNRGKGAKGPSEWVPSNFAYHCEYAELWQGVVDKYECRPPTADLDWIAATLNACERGERIRSVYPVLVTD